ncbi:MAG: MarR family transcriptional regulator [Alphaproteobacteria bacterium]|nr:MarR family transcriptional regulator [Alphaproteobacteria bacterium]
MKNDLLFVLHDVARLMRTRFDQRARSWGMTRAQCVILMRLDQQPGMSQTELATVCEVEPITVVRLIDRLEGNGLVERRADPSDRRIHRLHLLPAAAPILAEIARYRAEYVAKLREGIPEEEWNSALKVLLRIKDKVMAEISDPSGAAAEEHS